LGIKGPGEGYEVVRQLNHKRGGIHTLSNTREINARGKLPYTAEKESQRERNRRRATQKFLWGP